MITFVFLNPIKMDDDATMSFNYVEGGIFKGITNLIKIENLSFNLIREYNLSTMEVFNNGIRNIEFSNKAGIINDVNLIVTYL